MEKAKVMVKRDTYEKNGKSYFTYFINGKVRGVDVTAKVTPPDNGGYTLLEIVFGKEQEAELVCKPYEIKDEKTGSVIKGNTYGVKSVDEKGNVYECPIKPLRVSDKIAIGLLLNN